MECQSARRSFPILAQAYEAANAARVIANSMVASLGSDA